MITEVNGTAVSYSQNGEDEVIAAVFGNRIGRFLDIGAWDGRTFSNTLALAERGWTGVLIEPSPEGFIGLKRTHNGNEKMTLIQAAVGCEAGLVLFHNSPDAVSTTVEANYEKWKSAGQFDRPFYVPQITIEQILNQFGEGGFDFVNIDTEGTSVDLFLRLPLGALAPRCVCVEHDGRTVEVMQFAGPLGYAMRYLDGNNAILAR